MTYTPDPHSASATRHPSRGLPPCSVLSQHLASARHAGTSKVIAGRRQAVQDKGQIWGREVTLILR